jgi:hypothetical protein
LDRYGSAAVKDGNSTGYSRHRTGWAIGLAASIALNLALVTKIVVFDPNVVLRPLCFLNRGPFSGPFWPWDTGIREIDGAQSRYFRERIWIGSPPREYRIGNDGTVYISLLDRYRYEELIWNWTTKAVERIIREHEQELGLPPLNESERRWGERDIDCDLVRRIAIE